MTRVLVTASSRHGSTAEMAEVITRTLVEAGVDATCREPDDVQSLDGFDAVVMGSAVYVGRWLEPAKGLVERVRPQLANRAVWLFSSGPLGVPAKPEGDPADVESIRAATGAVDHRVFAGRLEADGLGLGEKLVVKGVRAPYGDYRPWAEITEWTQGIARQLQSAGAAAG
jgi:menaquinone-dependent protoporphyrinogen oxidase